METTTAEPTMQTAIEEVPTGGAVAIIGPERLPYHPAIEQRFGVDRAGWRALIDAVYPMAKSTEAVLLALSYCRARKLDPFKRVVHIVPMRNGALGRDVETVWPGIGELRTTAFRCGLYAGCDAADFGPDQTMAFTGAVRQKDGGYGKKTLTLTFPSWCQITVYRIVGNQRVAIPGPRVYWLEAYATHGRTELPNDMWQKRTRGQLEKCAEAAALRRAFPEEIGDQHTVEEMEGGRIDIGAEPTDITPAAQPTRASVAAALTPHDEDGVIPEDLDQQFAAAISGRMPDTAEERGDVTETAAENIISFPVPILPDGTGSDWPTWSMVLEAAWNGAGDVARKTILAGNREALESFAQQKPTAFRRWSARIGLTLSGGQGALV